ncbi:MAG: ATP-dependent sacrificial sulfur transferase LarE [Candidatus Eisenbacteria bacterium]
MSDSPLIQIGSTRPATDGLSWQERLARLETHLATFGSVVVAYSGGVDSSLVLRVAHHVLGERARGVIGRSDSYASRELELALAQAAAFGAGVEVVSTGELADPNFRSNPTDRCYHCKTELYRELTLVAERIGAAAILDGTILDDIADWRPGRRAAEEQHVRSPLAELGFTKDDVRAAAAHFGLASFDKPASPCLASRIPYGTEITRENLSQVERGEELLRSLGFGINRVRHFGESCRLEVPLADLPRLMEPAVRERATEGLKAIGYRFVTVDLEGFRSGNLNRLIGVATSDAANGAASSALVPGQIVTLAGAPTQNPSRD